MHLSLAAFLLAAAALLAAPGPSNTLAGVAGMQDGLRRVVLLLPALVAGYLCAVLPLAWAGANLTRVWPALMPGIRLAAAAWVLWLAVGLWRAGPRGAHGGAVSAARLWLTTLLNPKALVVALALLPPPADPRFGLRLALFAAISAVVAFGWGAIGAATRTGDAAGRLVGLQRLAAVWLLVVSAGLALSVLRA